jgi:hypothetical protein
MTSAVLAPSEYAGAVWRYTFARSREHLAVHSHVELEFSLVLRGRAAYVVDEARYDLGRGSSIRLFRSIADGDPQPREDVPDGKDRERRPPDTVILEEGDGGPEASDGQCDTDQVDQLVGAIHPALRSRIPAAASVG